MKKIYESALLAIACGCAFFPANALYEEDTAQLWPILSRIQGVWNAPPSDSGDYQFYTNGALLGNGEMGMSVCGGRHYLRLNIGKNSCFMPFQSNIAKIIIQKQSGGETSDAWSMVQNDQYAYSVTNCYLGGKPVQVKAWVSDSLDVAICEFSSSSASPVPVQILFQNAGTVKSVGTPGDSVLFVTKEYVGAFTHRCAYAVKLLGTAAATSTPDGSTAQMNFTLQPGATCKLVVRAGDNENAAASPVDTIRSFVRAFTDADASILYSQHLAFWKNFWLKAWVSFGDTTLEKYWYGHLYVMGCASRDGANKYCPGLYGPWAESDGMAWQGDIHNNYDASCPFYGVWSSNHCEISCPYSKAFITYAPLARTIAKNRDASHISADVLSIMPNPCTRGSWTAVGISNHGAITDNHDWNQPSMGVNALTPVVSKWNYSQDSGYLADTAYQLLLDQADWWEDILHTLGKSGGLYFTWGAAHEGWWNKNSTFDLSSVRYAFTQAINTSTVLGRDSLRRATWQGILDSLTPYLTEMYGGKVCFKPDAGASISGEVGGNAMCTVQWPAWDNMINVSDTVFLAILRNTALTIAGSWGIRGNDWGNLFTVLARSLYNPDSILYHITHTNPIRNNLTVFQNGGGLETSGILESFNSMMLQSHDGTIRVFPDWTKNQDCRFKRLRAYGAFLVNAQMTKGAAVDPVSIYSEKGRPCSLLSPWPGASSIYISDNGAAVAAARKGDYYSFPTSAGHTYQVSKTPSGIRRGFFGNPADPRYDVRYYGGRLVVFHEGGYRVTVMNLAGRTLAEFRGKGSSAFRLDRTAVTAGTCIVRVEDARNAKSVMVTVSR